ncbi:MAG: restriction endonuclease subunit S [Prevotella sp.]|nr:restriction endonuclease subunit S [Prevotella sp.]
MNAQQLRNSILQDLIHPQDGWIQRELKDVVDPQCPISYGIVQQGEHIEDGVPVVRPVDLHNKYVRRIGLKCTTQEISNSYSRTILNGNEILICVRGTTGIIGLATEEIKGCNVNRGIVPLFFQSCYDKKFMYYQLLSPLVQEAITENTTGSALKQINIKELRSIKFYIPPLAEQKRIVAKIEELLPKVEEYGKAQDALDKLNKELPEKLKKSILQEAIAGRLVPQDPNDEPASVLLDKIRQKKAQLVKEGKLKKKDLEEKPISEDEKPFDIPESWEWVKLGTLISYQNGYAYNSLEMNRIGKGVPVIKSGNLMTLEVVLKPNNDFIEYPTEKMLVSKIVKGDMLMCLSSQSDNPEPLGKTAIYKFDTYALLNQRVLKIRPYKDELTLYLYYTINSFYFWYNVSHQGGGSAQANLKLNHVLDMQIPLPPLAEQKRIVAKIEELFAEIDKLKM